MSPSRTDQPVAPPHALLFVCLGNICRSPLAKAIFIHQASARGVLDRFTVDSCGTGHWHAGRPADPRSIEVARRNGVAIDHIARQVSPGTDFDRFDLLLAMDRDNEETLLELGAPPAKVRLMRSFDPELAGKGAGGGRGEQGGGGVLEVPDPYTGSPDGFDRVFSMLQRACAGLLDHCLAKPDSSVHP